MYLFIYLSVRLSIYPSIHPSILLPIYLSIYLSLHFLSLEIKNHIPKHTTTDGIWALLSCYKQCSSLPPSLHGRLQPALLEVCWLVACLTSQQQASICQRWICSDILTCCHTKIEAADQTFYLTQWQYTDTRLTSPSTDPITPGTWLGSHWSAN